MKISTKGRYALRMLLELAQSPEGEYIALKDIAEHQNISKKYLEQIVPPLSRAGLLKTNRGYKGGYMLAKNPDLYTVGEILRVTEGDLSPVPDLEHPENENSNIERCISLYVWEGLYKVITEYVDSITLQDIINHSESLYGNDYCI